jgi:hypothetical protein
MNLTISNGTRGRSMLDERTDVLALLHDCDNLMKNSRLSLYGDVAMLKRDAKTARSNRSLLSKLRTDLSLLIERLSSTEKLTYLQCCENDKETRTWVLTEP